MCTALSYRTKDHYFGRNLDLEYSYSEKITITPRNYPFQFRNGQRFTTHHALIGMATIAEGFPLYYEATNEKGLSLAALNFPGNAVYYPKAKSKTNIAPFELIPWLLGKCSSIKEAQAELRSLNLWNLPFSQEYPLSPLHWLMSDKDQSITLESTADGMHIHENPIGILTNSPPFPFHIFNLANYMNLTKHPPVNRFSDKIELNAYSLGMGAIGLPGDPSSSSRFVKAAFTKLNSISGDSESESISQFFHILGSVQQPRGVTNVRDEEYEYTLYSSCCNTEKGIYYYNTYENAQISAVDMHREDLTGSNLITYPLITGQQIHYQN